MRGIGRRDGRVGVEVIAPQATIIVAIPLIGLLIYIDVVAGDFVLAGDTSLPGWTGRRRGGAERGVFESTVSFEIHGVVDVAKLSCPATGARVSAFDQGG